MRGVIDLVFAPVLNWLNSIFATLMQMSVPAARPLDLGKYMGPFILVGGYWMTFITVTVSGAVIYMICYFFVSQRGQVQSFKDLIKWW